MTQSESEPASPDPTLARLRASLGDAAVRGLPPVEAWNPPYCGEIDMRIAADGTWFHDGTPIRRPALVKLFASILRREPDGRFALVTPVEAVGITVEDAPFLAVDLAVEGAGAARRIAFRTNVDDLVPLDGDHVLRFEQDEAGGLRPYIHVRRGLWALLTRALTYDLVAMGEERTIAGEPWFGVEAAGAFHRIAPASA